MTPGRPRCACALWIQAARRLITSRVGTPIFMQEHDGCVTHDARSRAARALTEILQVSHDLIDTRGQRLGLPGR